MVFPNCSNGRRLEKRFYRSGSSLESTDFNPFYSISTLNDGNFLSKLSFFHVAKLSRKNAFVSNDSFTRRCVTSSLRLFHNLMSLYSINWDFVAPICGLLHPASAAFGGHLFFRAPLLRRLLRLVSQATYFITCFGIMGPRISALFSDEWKLVKKSGNKKRNNRRLDPERNK